ncbi:MAG: hypothetical protein ACK4P5_05805, partial [Fimbriimonadales bacterium]
VADWQLVAEFYGDIQERFSSLALSPDGNYIAAGTDRGTVRVWRVQDGQLVRTLVHPGWIRALAFTPDGAYLASGNWTGSIRIWRVRDGVVVRHYEHEMGTGVLALCFAPNGETFAYGRRDATVVCAAVDLPNPADLNGDGCVDDADLLIVLFNFGGGASGDANGDGVVDDGDLVMVLSHFGGGC